MFWASHRINGLGLIEDISKFNWPIDLFRQILKFQVILHETGLDWIVEYCLSYQRREPEFYHAALEFNVINSERHRVKHLPFDFFIRFVASKDALRLQIERDESVAKWGFLQVVWNRDGKLLDKILLNWYSNETEFRTFVSLMLDGMVRQYKRSDICFLLGGNNPRMSERYKKCLPSDEDGLKEDAFIYDRIPNYSTAQGKIDDSCRVSLDIPTRLVKWKHWIDPWVKFRVVRRRNDEGHFFNKFALHASKGFPESPLVRYVDNLRDSFDPSKMNEADFACCE
jgi:hypothetical protein